MKVVLMRRLKKGRTGTWFINSSKWFVADDFEKQEEFPFRRIGESTPAGESFSLDREYSSQEYYRFRTNMSDEVERIIAEQQLPEDGNEESYTVLLKLDIPNDLQYREFTKQDGNTNKVIYLNGRVGELVNSRKLIFLRNNDEWREESLLGELREWVDGDDATQIQSVLCRVLRDFKTSFNEMTEEEKREQIRLLQSIFSFGENPTPGIDSYSRRDVQQYYLMRYGYMYILKYYMMYTKLLQSQREIFLDEGIRVLSLGCGAKLDGMGMKMAIEKEMPECTYSYKGVDYSGWNQHGYDFKIGEDDFSQSDVIAFLEGQQELNQNVFIFPTSISEFDSIGILEGIIDKVKQKVTSEIFYVIGDVRYNQERQERERTETERTDRERLERVKEYFVNSNEFELVGEPIYLPENLENVTQDEKSWKNELEKEYIKRYHAVSIMKKIEVFLRDQTKHCADHDEPAEGQNEILEHHVMHYNEQVNFCIMKFRKIR